MLERLQAWVLAGEFSSPELTSCADSYSVSIPPRVTIVACKRLLSFCLKCRWQARTHPWPNKSQGGLTKLSRYSVGTYQGNELTCNLSENTRPQSSQLTEPLLTDPGLKSRIGVHKLSPFLKKQKAQAGNPWIPKILASKEKAIIRWVAVSHKFFCLFCAPPFPPIPPTNKQTRKIWKESWRPVHW